MVASRYLNDAVESGCCMYEMNQDMRLFVTRECAVNVRSLGKFGQKKLPGLTYVVFESPLDLETNRPNIICDIVPVATIIKCGKCIGWPWNLFFPVRLIP